MNLRDKTFEVNGDLYGQLIIRPSVFLMCYRFLSYFLDSLFR